MNSCLTQLIKPNTLAWQGKHLATLYGVLIYKFTSLSIIFKWTLQTHKKKA
jgi:hypothetical protein